ncbi:MAG TPA: DUF4286 family protein [Acidimicrobiia bacterium]|nr:DUF4286 family protein [Acidimicrobiia bacterium]
MSALLVVVVDVLPEHEEQFNRWYDEEHIPQKRSTPGFRSARRFRSHDVPGRYLAVYEVDDAGVVTNPEYMAQPMSEWAEVLMATWHLVDRSVWTELDAD